MNEPKSYLIEIAGQMPDVIYERALQEIVRCKDCRYCMNYWKCDYCDYFKKVVNDPDGFCAWAERREP